MEESPVHWSKDSQVFVVLRSLLEAAADRDDEVKLNIAKTIRDIAKNYPDETLQSISTYKKNHPKMSTNHISSVLQIAESICRTLDANKLDKDTTVKGLVELAIHEMTSTPDIVPEYQMSASQLLVALSRNFLQTVMEGIFSKFQSGVLPHCYILHTIGSIAVSNPFEMVPHIKTSLAIMLPMLNAIRLDHLKQACAYALGRFADAIQEYMANPDQVKDDTITQETFSSELNSAILVLINLWLPHARDLQMQDNILHAIASIFPLLPEGKPVELSNRLVPTILSLKRKSGSLPLPATRCLAAILTKLTSDTAETNSTLEQGLDNLFAALNELVFEAPDLEQPFTIKNHYEALRCFDILAKRFPDRVNHYLNNHLKAYSEKDRARGLVILAHLVSCEHTNLPDLSSVVKSLVNDNSLKVKRAIVKVVVVLAHKGHLKGCEGAEFLIYIINNANVQSNAKSDAISVHEKEELRQVCCDSIILLSSAAPQIASLLKPLILQCLVQAEYVQISGLLAKCINLILSREDDENQIADNEEIRAPNAFDILARCIILLSSPLPENGVHIVNILKSKKIINIFVKTEQVVDNSTCKMIEMLQGQTWDLNQWEEYVLQFVRDLGQAENKHWINELARAFIRQGQQNLMINERKIQLLSLACLASYTEDNTLPTTLIQDALDAARLFPASEEICALAITECACGGREEEKMQHLGICLSQLRLAAKDLQGSLGSASTASKLLPSFLANLSASERHRKGELAASGDRLRTAILLTYGELAEKAPGIEILPQLESTNVNEWMLKQLENTKDDRVRMAALKSINQVARAFHPNLNTGLVAFEVRDIALSLAVGQMALNRPEITKASIALATSLIPLSPTLNGGSRLLVLKASIDKVLVLLSADPLTEQNLEIIKETESLCNAAMLSAGVSPASLDEILTLIEPWLKASHLSQRTAVTTILASVLKYYVDHLQFGYENPTSFTITSNILSRIIPRCTDISPECRMLGVQCVCHALTLSECYEGRNVADVITELNNALVNNPTIKNICSDFPNELCEATMQLAKVICKYLPTKYMGNLVEGLIMSVADPEAVSSGGAIVVLNTVLIEKGAELFNQTRDILGLIIENSELIKIESTRTGLVQCVIPLTQHHCKSVIQGLLQQPLPYNTSTQSCWHAIAKVKDLAVETCNYLLSILGANALCEELKDSLSAKVALATPLAAVSGLLEMFSCHSEILSTYIESRDVFPKIFAALFLALGGFIGACPPVNMPSNTKRRTSSVPSFVPNRNAYHLIPGKLALKALREFLICAKLQETSEILALCTQVDTGESITSFINMVPHLAGNLIIKKPYIISNIVTSLNQHASSKFESDRIAVIAFIAELVSWSGAEYVLLDSLLQQLTESLDDSSTIVRQLALQGLSHVALLEQNQRERYISPVLIALLQGLDDSPSEGIGLGLAQEALNGLAALLPFVDKKQAFDLQPTLALRIKPFFTKDNVEVRKAAFKTLGQLAICTDNVVPQSGFTEQLTSSIVNLLVGLCDPDPYVIQVCKNTLRQVSKYLPAPKTASMLQDHLIDNATLQFPNFAPNLVKLMAEEIPDQFPYFVMTSLGFTKSQWTTVRSSATLLTGLLYYHTPTCQTQHISFDSVCNRLIQLLTDANATVRINAAVSIGYIFSAP